MQHQTTAQPLAGAPRLTTRSASLDASRPFGAQWQGRLYLRYIDRHHGDERLQVDERVFGVQASYQW